jgi:hypothetical protein
MAIVDHREASADWPHQSVYQLIFVKDLKFIQMKPNFDLKPN